MPLPNGSPAIAEIMAKSLEWYYARVALQEGRRAAAYYQGRQGVQSLGMWYRGRGAFTDRLVENRIQSAWRTELFKGDD
jgi:hypothetical protein